MLLPTQLDSCPVSVLQPVKCYALLSGRVVIVQVAKESFRLKLTFGFLHPLPSLTISSRRGLGRHHLHGLQSYSI